MSEILKKIRQLTPDRLRWSLGPYIAYAAYFFRMHIWGNKDAPHVLSLHDTLDLVIKNNLSVIRFGDGEMSLIQKNDIGFQKYDPGLVERLKQIIKVNRPGLLICIPGLFGKLDDFAGVAFWFALHHQFRYRQDWLNLLSPNQTYGDTLITRPYLGYKSSIRKNSGQVFKKLFSLWEAKDVLLIEGAKSRLGVGNDMFARARSLSRILCPPEDAYLKLEQVRAEALKTPKDKVVLLSLGPAAKVLAYDLFLAGYRVLDIGHLDMEYEMFLHNYAIETKVRFKYFNEIHERDPEECTDPQYLKQIIARIE